ncbi:unnamed protein product [Amaranthus hypochondriacus]
MKKKKLQIQARKASISFYYHQNLKNTCSTTGNNSLWYFDPSYCAPPDDHHFGFYDQESQICFGPFDQDHRHQTVGFQQFTVTHVSSENRGVIKQRCNSLDLQLGLSLDFDVIKSSPRDG